MSDLSSAALVALSEWIDGSPGYEGVCEEAVNWRRITKVCSEANEARDAFSDSLGENPRKGKTKELADVLYELLDTATAALGAYEHLTGHQGTALDQLDRHIVRVGERAGVVRVVGSDSENQP